MNVPERCHRIAWGGGSVRQAANLHVVGRRAPWKGFTQGSFVKSACGEPTGRKAEAGSGCEGAEMQAEVFLREQKAEEGGRVRRGGQEVKGAGSADGLDVRGIGGDGTGAVPAAA